MKGFRSFAALFLGMLLVMAIGGCQLAVKEEQWKTVNEDLSDKSENVFDRLIGGFLIIKNENEFMSEADSDGFPDEVTEALQNDKQNVVLTPDMDSRQEKVEGVKGKNRIYFFGKLKGYLFYVSEEKKFISIIKDKVFYNCTYNLNGGDGETGYDIKCNFALLGIKKNEGKYIKMLCVYKRKDGSVYVRQDTVWAKAPEVVPVKVVQKQREDINGKVTQQKSSVTLNIHVVDKLKNVRIKEMNDNNLLIKESIFTKQPKDIKYYLNNKANYMIVEEIYIDTNKKEYINRHLYNYKKHTGHVALKRKNAYELFKHECLFSTGKTQITPMRIKFFG